MNKTFLSAFICALLLCSSLAGLTVTSATVTASTDAPAVMWEQQLMHGDGHSIYPLADGGFVLSVTNETATMLVKTDSEGNVTYVKDVLINNEITTVPYMIPTSDGGYAFAGVWDNKFALVRTDSEGNLQWTKLWGTWAPLNFFRSIIQLRDDGFALAGFCQIRDEDEGNIWFARTDGDGNTLWNKTFSGPRSDCPSSIIELENGNFMMSDVSFSIIPNQAYMRLIEMDSQGNVLWNQTYGGVPGYQIPECNNAIIAADGGYLVSGFLAEQCAWVIKTDVNGNLEWNQTYGDVNAAMTCAKVTTDGGYIITGVLNVREAWVIKTDVKGNMIWNMTLDDATYPIGLEANFNSVIQADDGGYVIAGTKDQSAWIIKLASDQKQESSFPVWQAAVIVVAVAAVLGAVIVVMQRKRRQPNPT